MSKESFGLQSTNPRQRRAYAHALRDKAIASGEPQDKLAAVEAAKTASATTKGRELGHQALSAFRRSTSKELRPVSPLLHTHTHTEFTGNDIYARASETVASIDGKSMGVSVQVERPEDKEGYIDAVRRGDTSRVRNSAGMLMYDINRSAVPADTPKTEAAIESVADYHQREGSHVINVTSTHDTGNFYRTVESVTEPHHPVPTKHS
jgi:hypothetical protein